MAPTKVSTETKERKRSKTAKSSTSEPIDAAIQPETEESVAVPDPVKKKKRSKTSKSEASNVIKSAPEPIVESTTSLEPTDKKEKKKSKKSKSTTSGLLESAPEAIAEDTTTSQTVAEKEKKSKKDKKSGKSKSSNLPGEEIATLVALSDEEDPKPSKKRKRPQTIEDEIEIDVALPEPLSKKAARKAKKAKTIESNQEGEGEESDEKAEPTIPSSGPKEKKERHTAWGIWIGNLPWSASKSDVKEFLCKHAKLDTHEITRIHMPVPFNAPVRNGEKPKNKGFAYLDFDSQEALEAAIKVSETQFNNDHRKVLIKQSTSFEGRPDPKTEEEAKQDDNGLSALAADKMNTQKPPSKRVFVGNLGFDTTKDDLQNHFAQCGEITDIFMATFQDSGKCKGFAWITFTTEEAGIAAVRGWIIKGKDQSSDSESESEDEGEKKEAPVKDAVLAAELKAEGYADVDNAETAKILKQRLGKTKQKKKKAHKWFVNKMSGRALRCEFAEDAGVRYKKRYGKDAQKKDGEDTVMGEGGDTAEGATTATEEAGTRKEKKTTGLTPHERRKEARRAANKREFGAPDVAKVGA